MEVLRKVHKLNHLRDKTAEYPVRDPGLVVSVRCSLSICVDA